MQSGPNNAWRVSTNRRRQAGFRFRLPVLGLCAAMLAGAQTLVAATWYVATNGSDATGTGTLASPYRTISNAVAQAADNDAVWVSNGTYQVVEPVRLTKPITVRGFSGDRGDTVVDGNGAAHCLLVSNDAALAAHLTISNGYASDRGGGLRLYYGLVSNCVVKHNASDGQGGGVFLDRGILRNSWISENFAAGDGGGIYKNNFAGQVIDCVISNNTIGPAGSGLGAGIYVVGPMSNCTIAGNTVESPTGGGGGAYNNGQISACIFSNNTSYGPGGGVYMASNTRTLLDCIVDGNTSMREGGGVYGGAARACTIRNNSALTNGGGLYFKAAGDWASNCVISGNSAGGDTYGGGGGVYFSYNGLVADSILESNTALNAKYGGGACFFVGGAMFGCVLKANSATNGGGAFVNRGGALTNCLIIGNAATNGGGVYLTHSYLTVTNWVSSCTIAGNHAARQGGGAWVDGIHNRIVNTIVYSNAAGLSGTDAYHGVPACTNIYFYSCLPVELPAGQGNLNGNPGFENAAGDNWRLAAGSPCINAGSNQPWMSGARDVEGNLRLDRLSRLVDMGAYEHIHRCTLFTTR